VRQRWSQRTKDAGGGCEAADVEASRRRAAAAAARATARAVHGLISHVRPPGDVRGNLQE